VRRTPRQRRRHVVQGGAAQRGDDADGERERGQRPLRRDVEQTLRLEHRLEPQEAFVEGAGAAPLYGLDDELELAARLVHREASAQLDRVAVRRQPAGELRRAANMAQRSAALPSGSFRLK
jgi:hypothetical protein